MSSSMKSWVLNNDMLSFSGQLDREVVPLLWRDLKQLKYAQNELLVSLEKVERIDSAGMVMLIHLIEHAKSQNCHIMLSFVPEQLMTLIQLSNVESLIEKHI
ncbi:STAS domain-containing protein [Vibrio sp. ZSDZ34]|uniref:STAS domain-containing protein n=1 Tax=Vibrio gelatinilyticus TaxID=2893468 RepID=A0A9X1WF76_9VIBR|nr:STAS domain-containing protein [Vibrio gelatinilyticus]MCJ2378335.1 STAS domain-containing protein [Vibrio gelatinilyticus]